MAEISRSTKGYHESIPGNKRFAVWFDCGLHVLRVFDEWQGMKNNPAQLAEMVGLGILAARLCCWAVRLLLKPARS